MLLTILILNNKEFTTNIMSSNNILNDTIIVLMYTYGSTLIDTYPSECNCRIKVNSDIKMTVDRYITNSDV